MTCFWARVQATPTPGRAGEVSCELSPDYFSPFSDLGSSLFVLVFFFFFLPSLGSSLICSGFFFDIYKVGNRVLETRFPCVCHVEKYATLDHIRP